MFFRVPGSIQFSECPKYKYMNRHLDLINTDQILSSSKYTFYQTLKHCCGYVLCTAFSTEQSPMAFCQACHCFLKYLNKVSWAWNVRLVSAIVWCPIYLWLKDLQHGCQLHFVYEEVEQDSHLLQSDCSSKQIDTYRFGYRYHRESVLEHGEGLNCILWVT